MRYLSFYVDGERFAVDVTLVAKVARNLAITPVPTAPPAVVGIANLKGRVITILSLASLVGYPQGKEPSAPGAESFHIIILKPFAGSEDQMGLLVDKPGALVDISEECILPKPLAAGEAERDPVSGIAEINGALFRIVGMEPILGRFRGGDEDTVS